MSLPEEAMRALDTLHTRLPSWKLVNRDRVTGSLEAESRGCGRRDGYKLRAAGIANVFPANLPRALRGLA